MDTVLLAIDVGNTNIVLGLYADVPGDGTSKDVTNAPLVRDWRMRTERSRTA